ncbi:MAG: hypothetical protein AB1805_12795 [Nitrospirota bacterium]
MKALKWVLLAAAVFLIQTQFSSLKGLVNGTVILVYLFGLKSRQEIATHGYTSTRAELESTLFGMAVGLVEDLLSGSIIGPGVLSKGLLGLTASIVFTDLVFRWTPLWGGVILAVFTSLDGGMLIGTRVFFTGVEVGSVTALQVLLIQPLMNIPFGIIIKPLEQSRL